jgi:hypothetical protein
MIIPAMGAKNAMIKLGTVSMSFTRNSAFSIDLNASAILGNAGDIADTDMTVKLLAMSKTILLLSVSAFISAFQYTSPYRV